jgi:hypothetical protein
LATWSCQIGHWANTGSGADSVLVAAADPSLKCKNKDFMGFSIFFPIFQFVPNLTGQNVQIQIAWAFFIFLAIN